MRFFSFREPDLALLAFSFFAFIGAAAIPFLIEAVFGQYSVLAFPWIFLGVSFHEVGHYFVSRLLVSPVLHALGIWQGYAVSPMDYLGGFFFSCFCAIALLAFSLWLQSKISRGLLSGERQPAVFSFMLVAYVNLYFVNVTMTHLPSVVGSGLDFTMASAELGISLDGLIAQLWIIHWTVFALAAIVNFLFVFGKKPQEPEGFYSSQQF